jgi:integrase
MRRRQRLDCLALDPRDGGERSGDRRLQAPKVGVLDDQPRPPDGGVVLVLVHVEERQHQPERFEWLLARLLIRRRPTLPAVGEVAAAEAFGTVALRDLERMPGEIAAWQAKLPERSRYGICQALRQTLGSAERWGHIARNPARLAGRNPQPPPRAVRAYNFAELEAIVAELSPRYRTLPAFVAATGLRPEEWQALERRDVDRRAGVLSIRRTVSSGEVVDLGKTTRSRRQVPLSPRALEAIDAFPPRLDSRYLIPARRGGSFDLDNFRRREWGPAVEASGVRTPARIYDLRSTFASNALAAGVSVFELARVMGTSVAMIERHYGTVIEGAGADIARRLGAFEAAHGEVPEDGVESV